MLCEAPAIFRPFFSTVRVVLEGETFKRFCFADADAQRSLLAYVDLDQLPPKVGGTYIGSQTPNLHIADETAAFQDTMCSRFPVARNMTARVGILPRVLIYPGGVSGVHITDVVVNARGVRDLEITLESSTVEVSWSFRVDGHSIKLQRRVALPDPSAKDGLSFLSLWEEEQSQSLFGKLKIAQDWFGGSLILSLDNIFSISTKKRVHCAIQVYAT